MDIVDAIGGVDVYVQNDMNYDDPYQDLHIHIKAGNQHLNGKDAEGFIRFRYGYAGADIARIDAQKIFMTAFIKKLMSIEGVSKLNDLVKEINANLNTNVSLSDALYFATNALDLDLTKVVMLTMPGTPAYINNVSYYLVNKTALMENINTYLNKYSEPLDESRFLVVQGTSKNTSREPLTATDIEEKQPDLGWLHSSKKTDAGSKNTGSTSGTSTSTEPTDASKPTVPDKPNHAQEQTEPTDNTSSEPPVVTPAQNQTGSVDSTPNPTEQTPASPNPTVSSDDTVPDKSTENAENAENEPAGNPVISDMDDLLREYHAA